VRKFAHVSLDNFTIEIFAVGAVETGAQIFLDAHQHLGAHACIIPLAGMSQSITDLMKKTTTALNLKVEFLRETDGRWIADIPALAGVTVYGKTRKQALGAAEALALRVIADRIEYGEAVPGHPRLSLR
jgi:predicted RNase H-like HicB family nuclease